MEKKDSFYNDEIEYAGSAILLTENNAPDVVGVLQQAMETLDFESDVRLYCNRYLSLVPAFSKTNRCYICVPEIALRLLSKPQLQFLFGRCITAFKGNMTKMFTLSNYIGVSDGDLLTAPIGQWKRKALLSLDRGGLLACQDYDAVMKHLLFLSGVPLRDLNDIDLEARMQDIVRMLSEEKGVANKIGTVKNTMLKNRVLYSRERLLELYNWYESGAYAQIIQIHT